jgi:hypothetical protein
MNHELARTYTNRNSPVPPCCPSSGQNNGQSTVSKLRNLAPPLHTKAINANAKRAETGIDIVLVSARLTNFASSEGPCPYSGSSSFLRTRANTHDPTCTIQLQSHLEEAMMTRDTDLECFHFQNRLHSASLMIQYGMR